MTLRQRVKFTRMIYGITQKTLAQALGTSREYISMIENNNGNVGATDERLEEIINMIYKLGSADRVDKLEEVLEECKKNNAKKNKNKGNK